MVVCIFGKPDVTIWSSRDTVQVAEEIGHGELADRARRSDTPDLVVPPVEVSFGIPEVAIWSTRDVVGIITRGERECTDYTSRSDTPEGTLWNIVPNKSNKPEIAIRPGRDTVWVRLRIWEREFADCACGGDAPDLAVLIGGTRIGKPQGTILPRGDVGRIAAR